MGFPPWRPVMIDLQEVQAELTHARAARVAVEAAESEIEGLVHDMQSPAWPRGCRRTDSAKELYR